MNIESFFSKLRTDLMRLQQSDYYPFHMPGHKRMGEFVNPWGRDSEEIDGVCNVLKSRRKGEFVNPWAWDITEIDDFDNLHHATGILHKLQEDTARLFRAQESFFLINGSTCGILAAISAAVRPGKKLLLARNCHKAVYHGLILRQITPVYLLPPIHPLGIFGSVSPEAVELALQEDRSREIEAVLITSPTYDGIVSDVKEIAMIAHRHGIPLIVDEAHGAHFPFHESFPTSAISCGADVIIQSLHKTLPALTQTALLHLGHGSLFKREKIALFLQMYQTSSPSYLLMASIESCMRFLYTEGEAAFSVFRGRLSAFYEKVSSLQTIHVISRKDFPRDFCFDRDDSKILIFGDRCFCGLQMDKRTDSDTLSVANKYSGESQIVKPTDFSVSESKHFSGQQIYDILREEFHLQLEMAAENYALALTSVADTEDGFSRLADALSSIDRVVAHSTADRAEAANPATATISSAKDEEKLYQAVKVADITNIGSDNTDYDCLKQLPTYKMNPWEALEAPFVCLPLAKSIGRVSQGFLSLYPPGVPLLVPGEVIDEVMISHLEQMRAKGLDLQGFAESGDFGGEQPLIKVVK
ncbi:hypothetical protein FACS1894111_10560 [Clostridia bacterium]|nr:hypothetical protein FACS1894111_10560 [Clostridia bacterium]